MNTGTQGVQELHSGEFKALGGSSYDKVNPTSLFCSDVHRQRKIKKICLSVGVAYKTF